MNYLRWLLLPLSFLYGLVVFIRNLLYDFKLFSVTSFDTPIISVGNLTSGGTGKTPHVDFLVTLLMKDKNIAILSRGYGRKTKGFIIASISSSASEIGDESKQYQTKFPNITVAVSESRVLGVQEILNRQPAVNLILLDDAFQHRAIQPGLSILLIDYKDVFQTNFLLPAGSLREWPCGARRADCIIITKTPEAFPPELEKQALENIKIRPHQKIYFSYIQYGNPVALADNRSPAQKMAYYSENKYAILMLTGIAKPEPLITYLKSFSMDLETAIFPDHHEFTKKEIEAVITSFTKIKNPKKIIVTTQKDAMRLMKPEFASLQSLPIFYIPIEIRFHERHATAFNEEVFKFVSHH
jgi:tetraacyldisaccharide 4'-kinase